MIVYARYDARLNKDPLTGKERKVKYKSLQYVIEIKNLIENYLDFLLNLLKRNFYLKSNFFQ